MRHRPIEVQARRQKVAALYLAGHYQHEIARDLSISQQQVSHDLRQVRAEWMTRAVQDIGVLQQEELEKISAIEREAWAAFARSKLDTESTIQEKHDGKLKVSRRVEKRVGEVRWLGIILDCISRRCDLLGLAAPRKFQIDFDALTEQQLVRLANGEPPERVLNQPGPAPIAEA